MERRILLAAVLSAIVMLVYARTLPKQPLQVPSPSVERGVLSAPTESEISSGAFASQNASQLIHDEEVIYIDSRDIQLEVGRESASIRRAVLKQYADLDSGEPLEFGGKIPVLSILVHGAPLHGKVVSQSANSVEWEVEDVHGNNYHIIMAIDSYNQLVDIELYSTESVGHPGDTLPIQLMVGWNRGDDLGNRHNPLQTFILTKKEQAWQRTYVGRYGTQKASKSVSRGTELVTLTDRHFCLSLRTSPDPGDASFEPAPEGWIAANAVVAAPLDREGMVVMSSQLYIGTRDHFALKQAGFVSAFKLGVIGKIGIALLAIMTWIAGVTHNYGVAILIFSFMVTCCMAPFTLMSMRSMKKMQELKPQIDRIMAKQKSNPQKANAEMMALYKEHKVSPLSGCLPMLLQFPVLIALFQSITNFVKLRGERFLWIKDLSLPDRVAELPFTLPILGKHLNLLPLIMMGAMLVQMRMSQKQMSGAQNNPMAKIMSGPMMSVIFGVMFYQFPAGLVLYWLTNSVMTVVWYKVAKI